MRTNNSSTVRQPRKLPFIDNVMRRFNVRVDRTHEATLLATYERYWVIANSLGSVAGEERRFLSKLAKKYNSFLYQQL